MLLDNGLPLEDQLDAIVGLVGVQKVRENRIRRTDPLVRLWDAETLEELRPDRVFAGAEALK